MGCGVGNTLYPLLEEIPGARGYACDFSATAVECLKQHPAYDAARVTAWEADITDAGGLCGPSRAPVGAVDYCTLIFVLSALAPERMPEVRRRPSDSTTLHPKNIAEGGVQCPVWRVLKAGAEARGE